MYLASMLKEEKIQILLVYCILNTIRVRIRSLLFLTWGYKSSINCVLFRANILQIRPTFSNVKKLKNPNAQKGFFKKCK